MLIEFRVENFRSFKGEQVLSMVASGSEKSLPDNCMDAGKLKLVRGAAIYGPNASGKSNLIKALDVMQDLVLGSADSRPGRFLPVIPFLLHSDCKKQPSKFEVVFLHKGVRYQYGFSATSGEIMTEWLYAFPKQQARTLYKRTVDTRTGKPVMSFGSSLKGDKSGLWEKTRPDVLFLSAAAQWNHEQLKPVHEWFTKYLRVVTPGVDLQVTGPLLHLGQKRPPSDRMLQKYVHNFLLNADLGVSGLEVTEVPLDQIRFPEEISAERRQKIMEDMKSEPILNIVMLHKAVDADTVVRLPLQEESDGTRRMFDLAIPWLESLSNGYTIVVDEFEASLHSLLARELVKPFFDPLFRKSGAQLIFTTHDTTLLDQELFRRDQIWFTEKDEEGATQLIPLSDYKPRTGEALQKGYLSGRYGAVPILKAFSIHDTEA